MIFMVGNKLTTIHLVPGEPHSPLSPSRFPCVPVEALRSLVATLRHAISFELPLSRATLRRTVMKQDLAANNVIFLGKSHRGANMREHLHQDRPLQARLTWLKHIYHQEN